MRKPDGLAKAADPPKVDAAAEVVEDGWKEKPMAIKGVHVIVYHMVLDTYSVFDQSFLCAFIWFVGITRQAGKNNYCFDAVDSLLINFVYTKYLQLLLSLHVVLVCRLFDQGVNASQMGKRAIGNRRLIAFIHAL